VEDLPDISIKLNLRAPETVSRRGIIASPMDRRQPMPGLMEMNYGDWQGLRNDIKQKYPDLWRKSVDFDPGQCATPRESYRDVMERSLILF